MRRHLFYFVLFVLEIVTCRDQVWRILPQEEDQVELLSELIQSLAKVDVWMGPTKSGRPVDLRLTDDDISYVIEVLRRNKISYHVMINDVHELIGTRRHKRSLTKVDAIEDFDYEIYHPVDEIEQWVDIVTSQLDFVEKLQIGVTYEGRPIHALKITSSNPGGPAIYVDSLIHSREWIAGAASIYAFAQILSNSSVSWMLEDLNWFFVPMINADGYVKTWTTDRLWRKTNSEHAGLRCRGTDSNRNFDNHWEDLVGSSSQPCTTRFHGPFPESESETRHIARFIRGNNDVIKAVVTVHSYAQVVIYPFNYKLGEYPINNDEQNRTAAAMSSAMYKLYNTTYEYGPAAETLAPATGVTTDWSQVEGGIDINYTVELRDTGEFGFLLPEDQIVPTGEELLAGLKVLAEHVKTKYNAT